MRYVLGIAVVTMLAWTNLAQTADTPQTKPTNPVSFDVANLKRGRQYYTVHCIRCHGADGRGDTEMREFLKTPPADLSDDQWVYGGADAAVFRVVTQGATARDMPAFGQQLDTQQTWQVINYIRYLGGQRP